MNATLRLTLFAACALWSTGCATTSQNAGAPGLGGIQAASSSAGSRLTHQVAFRLPVTGAGARGVREFAADRPAANLPRPAAIPRAKSATWTLQATLPGAVIHDISFASLTTGYAAAELGQVWKTSDGGASWTNVLDLGFPYYFYGVTTLSAQDVVVSGFNDNNFEGLIRWSHDGGTTWSGDIVLTTTGWSDRVRFASQDVGLVVDQLNTQAANAAHYTTDGGAGQSDWTEVVPDPSGGWFGDEFSLLSNQHARMSGITYCSSANAGRTWACGPSIDSVFDGPVYFANDKAGWVGGGEISPNVAGWVHRTTNGGKTWSARTLNSPFPIRELLFSTTKLGWAAGGNIYSNVGGIYLTKDGGQTWTQELDTGGAEMSSCDKQPSGKKFQVWCAGYDSSLNGVVYTTRSR